MKNFMKTLAVVFAIIAVYVALGFVITVIRYAADKPIAKVELIKICLSEGGESHWGGYYPGREFANVRILEVYDSKEFNKVTLKVSKDGQRANLKFSDGAFKKGNTAKCYGTKSFRGCGLSNWWANFGLYWKRATSLLIGLTILAIVAMGIATRKK